MKSYDVDKIKMKSDKEPKIEELLTGQYITGIKRPTETPPNSELENKEYVRFPDGTVQKVVGEKHEKGGVKMFIPDGTEIVSAELKPTASQKKALKNDYDITVSKSDTYASVIDKFKRQIGLTKNYDEQEEIIKLMKKEESKEIPTGTRNINNQYISEKLNTLSGEAKNLEKKVSDFFTYTFGMQEDSKSDAKAKKISEGVMKYGGVSEQQFKDLCDKFGISKERGLELIGEKVPQFVEGGKLEELKKQYPNEQAIETAFEDRLLTNDEYQALILWARGDGTEFTTESGAHAYSSEDEYQRVHQSKSSGAFGKIEEGDIGTVLTELYKSFPDIVEEELGFKFDKDGNPTWDKSIDFTKENPKVRKFQERADKRMRESDESILSDEASKYFSGEFRDVARQHLDKETFGEGTARGFDGKLGNFTSGRYINSVNVLTPEELSKINGMNLFTLSQVENELKKDPSLLSDETKDRINKLREISKEGADYRLNQFTPMKTQELDEVVVEAKRPPGMKDDITPPRAGYPRLFMSPNQIPLPPGGMESHLMATTRLQRMDPVRIGIEPQIQQAGEARQFISDKAFGELNPAVAMALLTQKDAELTRSLNEEARMANITNATNLANTELFNIGQAAQEQEAKNRNLLSFEGRQMMAKAKTDEEVRNFYDQLRRINISEFEMNQTLNLLNQTAEDYNLGFSGMSVDYDPSSDWKVRKNPYYGLFGSSPFV